MITNKHIFITGGAGFIANTLIARLIEQNTITVYDNFSRDTLSTSPYASHRNLKVVQGDVLNYDLVQTSMQGADIVVHAAAIAGIETVIKSPVTTIRVNMLGTANVLEAAYRNHVAGRVIDFSTSEVFGSMAFKSSETDNAVAGSAGEARWTYAVSKLVGEHLARAYHDEFGVPTVTVRPFNVYGPGQTGDSAMRTFIKRALKHEDLYIHGDGNQIRAWCYIDDFVNGLLRCIEDPKAVGESFNIGNARAVITIYGLAQTVCRILNARSKILFAPQPRADIELRIPEVRKMEEMLGFKAQVDLDEGIQRTAEWLSKQGF